ncbi:MAG: DUF2334 domain-containing protein [Candidatus Omnitrophica bacterium]|nr:DUF2334 domain-containing protein [Candidatus Omnitrophota bacterium]MDE2008565.1 DUF2334 domain-containing protein [Candidatus Omnitrophota bacterium]MDE2230991.1 DUF2334 domain-containing protein [Candidatus Omnitrophota bacterium]
MSARLFIRNDDVWRLDDEFRYFFDSAMDRGIPVVHAVIPGRMDRGLVGFLRRAKEKTPFMLDIVQHGWAHDNHSVDAGTKFEFGPGRSLKNQREDIRRGLESMRRAFGDLFTPAFVPPYHGYDERTLQALSGEGFKIFSAGSRRPGRRRAWIEIPALISFTRYDQGRKSICRAAQVLAGLTRQVDRQALSGVLTHHEDFRGALRRRELIRFLDYVAALKAKKGWRVMLFSEILSGSKKRQGHG